VVTLRSTTGNAATVACALEETTEKVGKNRHDPQGQWLTGPQLKWVARWAQR
jgi:tetrahydromethanopterin S-methyltransferase subunit E